MNTFKIDLQTNRTNKDSENCSIMDKVHDYKEYLQEHEHRGLNVLKKSPIISACDREITIYDRHSGTNKKALMFGSNNYLGIIVNEAIISKATEVTREYGIGSGGVPMLSGTTKYHDDLEKLLSKTTGFDDTILFSSGFTANLGAILGLIRPNNLILQDRLNHASLMDGGMMSGAKMIRYKHNDPKDLERLLELYHKEYPGGIMVITDGVFSMDGDIANIPELLKVVRKYNAILLVDEAHSTGVIGPKGTGTLAYHNIKDKSNIILTGTLSKALGSVGGYVTASQEIIDYLRIFARSNLYSTSLPPSVCASAIEVLNYIRESDIIEKLNKNAEYLRNKLKTDGFNILDTVTPIVPVVIGDDYKLTMISKDLMDKGIYTSCIFSPVVPAKTSRIRLNVMASHTKADMDYLAEVLNELAEKYNIK